MAAVLGLVVHAVEACYLEQDVDWVHVRRRFIASRAGCQYLLSLSIFLRLELQGLAEGNVLMSDKEEY